MKALRYDNLVAEIDRVKPARIVEVGTCKGERSEMMIRAALKHRLDVEYVGFDLFEPPPEAEFSARTQPEALERVTLRLGGLGAKVTLVKGDSRKTLKHPKVRNIDLAFIDGGHSDETVRSDFAAILPAMRPGAPIMLDDYWNYPGGGGCNALVDGLDREAFEVTLLEPVDVFRKPYGELRTQMVKVTAR
jgi:predicted O-methyltransferase YrrM